MACLPWPSVCVITTQVLAYKEHPLNYSQTTFETQDIYKYIWVFFLGRLSFTVEHTLACLCVYIYMITRDSESRLFSLLKAWCMHELMAGVYHPPGAVSSVRLCGKTREIRTKALTAFLVGV